MSPERKGMADSQTFAPGESVDGRESPVEDSPPSERLMAAAGLHHLLGNHQHILSDCLYRAPDLLYLICCPLLTR